MQPRLSIKDIYSKRSAKTISKRNHELEAYKNDLDIDDHLISHLELCKRYGTHMELGLTEEIAANLLAKNGPNRLRPRAARNACEIFMFHMFCGFAAVLWVGVLLSCGGILLSHLYMNEDTKSSHVFLVVILLFLIVSTGLFGFYQEAQNLHVAKTFKAMLPKYSNVIRNGELYSINTEKLVVGDLVRLRGGDCVPADICITQCKGMKVDNSCITGESQPQLRSSQMTNLNPLETRNLAFYGTTVVEGSGYGIVIACGDQTFIGNVSALAARLEMGQSPTQRDLVRFIRIITVMAFACATVFFIAALCFQRDLLIAAYNFVVIVLALIPEGLLVTMTAALSLTASKMYRKKCLYKNVTAIETLGSATVLCVDKTGTLTQNRMTVSHMFYDGTIVDVLSENYTRSNSQAFSSLCLVGILCSRAKFVMNQSNTAVNKRKIIGDASESAVLKWMEIVTGRQTDMIRAIHPKVFEIPFNSANRYQLSIHALPEGDRLFLVMKGAPERILPKCTHISVNETVVQLDDDGRQTLKNVLVELSCMGERVLAFADLLLDASFTEAHEFNIEQIDFPTEGLRFVGFMSMIDPPRSNSLKMVQKCKNAGIKVMMITGDHPITALAIAKKVGVIAVDNETALDIAMRRHVSLTKITEHDLMQCAAVVLSGDEMRDLGEDELEEILRSYDEIVCARTTPQQKVHIVEMLQKNGEIVGVTGDGINDSPALKKANVGIALGLHGSEVAKDAADIVILDDNIESIVVAVEEGRLIYDNMKKSIVYLLTTGVPEMAPFVLHVLGNTPLPLSAAAILIIDVGTNIWPAISLVYERAEADLMYRRPRDVKNDHLVTVRMFLYSHLIIGMMQAMAGFSCWFFFMAEFGFLPERLIGLWDEWMSAHNDVLDSYRREWSVVERKYLEYMGHSAYFLGVLLTQIADCVCAKTRRLSILHQGMNNTMMNFGILFEIIMGILLVYCPYVNSFFHFGAIPVYVIAPAVPFTLLMLIFDEMRKYLIRRRPGGWFERETYF